MMISWWVFVFVVARVIIRDPLMLRENSPGALNLWLLLILTQVTSTKRVHF